MIEALQVNLGVWLIDFHLNVAFGVRLVLISTLGVWLIDYLLNLAFGVILDFISTLGG